MQLPGSPHLNEFGAMASNIQSDVQLASTIQTQVRSVLLQISKIQTINNLHCCRGVWHTP